MVITATFCIKKKCYISSDIIGLNYDIAEIVENRESYHILSLWIYRKNIRLRPRPECMYFYLFLLLCGDIELCSGPTNTNEFTRFLSLKGLKIFHHNIRGLFNNIENVTELFSRYKHIDILTLSETHINHDEPGECSTSTDTILCDKHNESRSA